MNTNKYQQSLLHITPFVFQEGKKEINDENLKHLYNLQELIDNYMGLEKALDKACEKIQFYDGLFPRSLTTKMSKEEWKEWLLKDE